jgi:serine/threonine protein kinase
LERIGTYRLLAALAKGGMGEVYLATDIQLKRKVAICGSSTCFVEPVPA